MNTCLCLYFLLGEMITSLFFQCCQVDVVSCRVSPALKMENNCSIDMEIYQYLDSYTGATESCKTCILSISISSIFKYLHALQNWISKKHYRAC